MSREDVESHPSHSRSRSCQLPGRPSVVDFLQDSMPRPEKRSLPLADGFSLSPVSAYSRTGSWSGSSNTEEQQSPLTPEFVLPAAATVVRSNETPITAFLSQFYDAEPSPDAAQLRFSAPEDLHRLDLFKNRNEDIAMLVQLPVYSPKGTLDHIVAEIPDGLVQVLPEDHLLVETAPAIGEHEIEPHPPLPDVRKARRFACDFVSAGWSQGPLSVRSDQDPALPRPPTGVQETSVASQELDVSLASANLSASSSTVPLAFEFPSPPPMSRNIGLLSETETKKVQEFLRGWSEREGRRGSAAAGPMLHHDNAPQVPPKSGDRASDEFSWNPGHPDCDVDDGLGDATRCSALIHEVSLMVGLPSEEDQILPGDGRPPVPDVPENVECQNQDTTGATDIYVEMQPPSPPETRFFSPRRPRNICPPSQKTMSIGVRTTDAPISPNGEQHDDWRRGALHGDYPFLARKFKSVDAFPIKSPQLSPILPLSPQKSLAVRPRGVDAPIPRYKSAENVRLSQSARRRQGYIFMPRGSLDHGANGSSLDINEVFTHPREPAPKPTTSPANRISALDRLESSLDRLKAHAPGHHHKSQSEAGGPMRASKGLAQATEKRPSLPSVLRPRKQRSSHDISHRNVAHSVRGRHYSSSIPPVSGPSWAAPQDAMESICPTAPLSVTCPSGKRAPVGSFMDMDAHIQKPTQPHRASFRSSVNKEKVKKLVKAAARMSQGVIAWGKSLTGSIKSGNTRGETSPSRSAVIS
ncbi:hypothetical protein PAXRUDRAFT_9998 [Paxillus rubicundulus Ve08.2h10]|uniref:Uncharacterized protein n=1 Tax=Paxillus rubicundulus Ve08.2h10 TaxID=930991 RepID=A0A0D0E1K8_9AGAM|nr:hypothetical protein PAXRUDRAFT_9998 [Paxillus rubicundulus Ve08.2h10]